MATWLPRHGGATLSGIVLEVGVPRGVNVMTAYANRSARYDNHAGASIRCCDKGPR